MNEEAEKYWKRVGIANAFARLAIGDFPEKLRELAEAVRAGEWEDIAAAARQHIEPPSFADDFALNRVVWIAQYPEAFGLKSVTKGDILYLMGQLVPGWKMPNPRKTWKVLGLDHLPQARGDYEIPPAKMMAANERWEAEKRAEIAAIRGKLPRC